MNESILELHDVCKLYETSTEELSILVNLELLVDPGEKITITGESGCGKSTLMSIIGGIDSASSGSVRAGNYQVDKLSESELTEYRSNYLGFIFQFHFLLKDFTAAENVMLPAYMAGMKKKKAMERAEELLEDVRLFDRRKHYPSQLSGGERQRVAVARALINDPKLILADEPTGNLDEGNSRLVEELLFDLVNRYGKTLLLVTHDTMLASRGSRHFHLSGGSLKQI